ncbi:MAG: c-type cytochrome [Sphingopyxis sp.]
MSRYHNMIASALCAASIAVGFAVAHAQTPPPRQPRPAPATVPALNGAALYQSRCGGCHSIAANRVGPAHRGVVGRRAGSFAGYSYSPQLRGSNIVWTPANLDRWLQGPQAMVRGSRMFTTVANPAERAAIIAYLRTQN